MEEETRQISITITFDEVGRIGLNAPGHVPAPYLIGLLEYAKDLLLHENGDTPTSEVNLEAKVQ